MIHEFYAFMNLWRDAILTKQAQFITIFHSQKLASFFFPYRRCSEQLPWWSQIMPWLGKFHFIQWDFWTLRGKTCWIFYLSWVWYTSFLYKTYMCVWGIHGRLSMCFFLQKVLLNLLLPCQFSFATSRCQLCTSAQDHLENVSKYQTEFLNDADIL